MDVEKEEEDLEEVVKQEPEETEDSEASSRLSRLQFVLQKSAAYSSFLKERMDADKQRIAEEQRKKREEKSKPAPTKRGRGRPSKRALVVSDDELDTITTKRKRAMDGTAVPSATANAQETAETEEAPMFDQPELITGAKLKPYQLEGLQWMVSLDQNGISGILADEMGLGKTLQTIAFSAYLREQGRSKPFLVVCPLSVLHNWGDEYQKFAPKIPVCLYHGTPDERAEMRRTVMALPAPKSKPKPKPAPKPKAKPKAKRGRGRPRRVSTRKTRKAKPEVVEISSDSEEEEEKVEVEEEEKVEDEEEKVEDDDDDDEENPYADFPIVVTTYEMIIKDRIPLSRYPWGYIVVDEGHRLKNLDCKLMQEIKKYPSAGRMILTGTPLHNNLAELWSLLNFILPDIFDDLDQFQEWFNLPALQSTLPTSQSSQIISSLHAILKPFLLRRLKTDVETSLPPKKEYVLYAPLSMRQRDAYQMVLGGSIKEWLIKGGTGSEATDAKVEVKAEEDAEDTDREEERKKNENRKLRKRTSHVSYAVDGCDSKYFQMLERGDLDDRGRVKIKVSDEEKRLEEEKIGREFAFRQKVKKVNNMHLQNVVMQLRKVCSHPFLFDWPIDPKTMEPVLGEELINASGKTMVLDRLLRELFKRGHKVLLFSQFTTMLDIIEDWAVDYMKWPICRIDGSTGPMARREQMNQFQQGGNTPGAPCLFLLSTRAGGLGINLTAADTVIFYDQDWNPQMDAQAQDRAHRIGQTRPVLIFRLVSAHTVETKIMQRATEKRKLEALVIAKGKFKMPAAASSNKRETMAEMAASLLRLEGEKIEVVPDTKEGKASVLSDEHLDMLLDRSDSVFSERQKGWTSSGSREGKVAPAAEVEERVRNKAAFAVYEAPVEEGNDALAKMMGEEAELDG
ncbi:SNF2 family N-terminal domain-containing protein [Cyathus striatus]|nr:SNF2 family N-terminal domain-containing protein [Cyathus striatus]